MPYEVRWTDEAKLDLRGVPAFHRKPLLAAIGLLRRQALIEARNRKPLVEPLDGMPGETWEVRVGGYRVLYWVEEERTVAILRVIFKGSGTTADALTRGKTS